jgi:signal transduction histidine kinase
VSEAEDSESVPFNVWVGPAAREHCEYMLREQLTDATITALFARGAELSGPATLVLHADDLAGPHRAQLKELAGLALPGRPVVLGNGSGKDTLLDAINSWQVAQFITPDTLSLTLADGVREAHRSLCIELNVWRKIEELSAECHQLNSVTEELRVTQQRLIHTERLATVGSIVNTVLSRMREQFDYLENLKRAQRDVPRVGQLADIFEAAVAGIDSFGALLEDMLALTENREAKADQQSVNLDSLAERSWRLFGHDSLARRRNLEIDCRSGAIVHADPCRMIHVILNLLRNAAQATAANERISLRTRSEGEFGIIEIEDTGHGMNSDTLARIFTPFFTTKGKDGMGLGLRLAKATVERYGGDITCTSSPGEGTSFRIKLLRSA